MTREELIRNAQDIQRQTEEACLACGRDPKEVTILPVSKYVDTERMLWARELGFCAFGENYVQHITEKYENFPEIQWHLIGHLQRNKVKSIIGKLHMLQSLDNPALLLELEKQLAARDRMLDVLIQINIGQEPQKTGVLPAEYERLRDLALESRQVNLRGLMAVPPAGEDPEPYFLMMQEYSRELRAIDSGADILSMGMSKDYRCAIACGSTMIRVGTGLFGSRPVRN